MTRTEMSALFRLPSQSNPSLKEQNSYDNSFLLVLIKVTVLMCGKLLHATVKIVALRLTVLIFIYPKFQWHMLSHSEPMFLSWLCIDLLPGFWMSVSHFRIQILSFMKESVHYDQW